MSGILSLSFVVGTINHASALGNRGPHVVRSRSKTPGNKVLPSKATQRKDQRDATTNVKSAQKRAIAKARFRKKLDIWHAKIAEHENQLLDASYAVGAALAVVEHFNEKLERATQLNNEILANQGDKKEKHVLAFEAMTLGLGENSPAVKLKQAQKQEKLAVKELRRASAVLARTFESVPRKSIYGKLGKDGKAWNKRIFQNTPKAVKELSAKLELAMREGKVQKTLSLQVGDFATNWNLFSTRE